MGNKIKIIIVIFYMAIPCFFAAQKTDQPMIKQTSQHQDSVSFTIIWDNSLIPAKDGLELNEYLVNINNLDCSIFDGKLVRVSGRVTVIKGLSSCIGHRNDNGVKLLYQGRMDDTKYINNPIITIINRSEK